MYKLYTGLTAAQLIDEVLEDVKRNPLFLKEGAKALSKEPIKPNLIQKLMRELAVKAGFTDGKANGHAINPLSPHALRESFSSIMTGKSVPKTVTDFWLGHEIGEMANAYQEAQFEDVKRMYEEREVYLSVSAGEGIEKVKEVEERERQLQALVYNLLIENQELKNRIEKAEQRLDKIEKLIQEFFEAKS